MNVGSLLVGFGHRYNVLLCSRSGMVQCMVYRVYSLKFMVGKSTKTSIALNQSMEDLRTQREFRV